MSRLKANGLQDKSLREYTFANDKGYNPEMQKAHDYVVHWSEMKAKSIGLLLWGDVGTGKSFFAGCIANALLEQGVPVLMTNFSRILNALSGLYSEEKNQYIDSLNQYSLLIIDDLGIERSTEFALEQVFNVIDSRYRSKLPLIVTTNMTLEELKGVASEVGLPAYAAKQMADWIYKKKITRISEMTNIAVAKRALLEASFEIGAYPPSEYQKSKDGTIKYLYAAGPGRFVESVYIPTDDRANLCVSSQVGCKMNCLFCMTGKQGFTANLTANQILNQIQSLPENDSLTNIVFMGMGEPLDNVDELFKVLEILTAPYGYAWSPKRITVSTIGVTKGLKRFLEESECHLAVSLHSPYPMERLSLMPVEKAFPAREVIDLIKQYDFSHQRRVSFEYIVFKNLNDSLKHAEALSCLLGGIPCRVNLIRFHAIPNVSLETSDIAKMEAFRDFLNAKGVVCTIRASRGEDIFAACGMLSTAKNVTFV